jgi:hypothetical protein
LTVDYNDRFFRGLANSEGGDVGGETLFHYRQQGDVVWATYEGGAVRFGTLTALVREDGRLDVRYQQVAASGEFKAGRCVSVPEVLPDGRLCLHESWRWTEGGVGSGHSRVIEVPSSDPHEGPADREPPSA